MLCLHGAKVRCWLITAGPFLAATYGAIIADSNTSPGCSGPGLFFPTSRANEQDLAEILARVRESLGFDALTQWPAGVCVELAAASEGEGQRSRLSFGLNGRFVWQTQGRLRFTMGYDGCSQWSIDWSNTPYVYETGEKGPAEEQLCFFWILIGRWLDPQSNMSISLLDEVSDKNRAALSVKVKDSKNEYWLVVERATWRPMAVCKPEQLDHPLYRLEDYRPVVGFYFPHRIIRTEAAADGGQTVEEVTAVAAIPVTAQDPYRLETNWTNDTRFDASIRSRIRLKVAESGHLLVRPRINGQHAGWFLLDSGCSTVMIDPPAAKELGLSALEAASVKITEKGLWSARKKVELAVRRADDFQLGPMKISSLGLMEMPMAVLSSRIKTDLAGLCGYDVFRRAVFELDLRNRTLAIRDPAAYQTKGLDWVDFRYEGRSPVIRCPFEGDHQASFMIDTGDPGSVSIDQATVEKFDLLKGRKTTLHPTWGPQRGLRLTRMGRLDWMQIGAHRLEGIPDAEFDFVPDSAADQHEKPVGVIGVGLLKDFKVIFDYPHKRIAFIKLPGNKGAGNRDQQDHDEDN